MWHQNQQNGKKIDFDNEFSQSKFSVFRLLELQQVVQQSRRQNQQITNKLLLHKGILKALIDIALRPKYSEKIYDHQITTDYTYKSIQILNSLEFSEFVFRKKQISEDQVIQEEEQEDDLFQFMLKILQEQKPLQQTPLSYLGRLIIPMCYQKPKEMLLFLKENSETLKNILSHFYSHSIYDWFMRLLQSEDSDSFFEKEKIQLINRCIEQVQGQKNPELLIEQLENYQSFYESMLEKLDDRFDKAKYCSMIKKILQEEFCLDFLFEMEKNHKNEEISKKIINIFEAYLKFSISNRITNPNTSKFSDVGSQNSISQIRLNTEIINKLKAFINQKISIIAQNHKSNYILSYLRLLKLMNNLDNQFFQTILSYELLDSFLKLMQNFQNNNVLHNIIKDIIIDNILKGSNFKQICLLLLNQERQSNYFVKFLKNIHEKNSKHTYENQIYHIFKIILKKSEQDEEIVEKLKSSFYTEVKSVVKEKQTFYSKLIGGNPRKQSSCWDSSQELIIDQLFPKKSKSINLEEGKEDKEMQAEAIHGGQDHWFDYDLAMYSDESKDESLGMEEKSGDLMKNEPILRELKVQSVEVMEGVGNELELQGSFNKHFETYISFSVDQIFSEIDI